MIKYKSNEKLKKVIQKIELEILEVLFEEKNEIKINLHRTDDGDNSIEGYCLRIDYLTNEEEKFFLV